MHSRATAAAEPPCLRGGGEGRQLGAAGCQDSLHLSGLLLAGRARDGVCGGSCQGRARGQHLRIERGEAGRAGGSGRVGVAAAA